MKSIECICGTVQSGLERDRQMPSKIEARGSLSSLQPFHVDATSFGML